MKRLFKSLAQAPNQSDLDLRVNINSSNFVEKFVKEKLEFLKTFTQASNQSDLDLRMKRQFKSLTQASNQSDLDLRMNKNSSNFVEKFVKAKQIGRAHV